jgi:hypothetical protein
MSKRRRNKKIKGIPVPLNEILFCHSFDGAISVWRASIEKEYKYSSINCIPHNSSEIDSPFIKTFNCPITHFLVERDPHSHSTPMRLLTEEELHSVIEDNSYPLLQLMARKQLRNFRYLKAEQIREKLLRTLERKSKKPNNV